MQTVWLTLAATLMLAWLVLAVRGPRRVEGPSLAVLRYGVGWRTFALVLAVTPLCIMVYILWALPAPPPATLNMRAASLLTFSVVVGLPLIEVTCVQIVVTDEGLTRNSPWSGTLTLEWIDVERVGYSAVNRWFTVSGAGQTIRVSRYLGGIESFIETVRRKVAAERCMSARFEC